MLSATYFLKILFYLKRNIRDKEKERVKEGERVKKRESARERERERSSIHCFSSQMSVTPELGPSKDRSQETLKLPCRSGDPRTSTVISCFSRPKAEKYCHFNHVNKLMNTSKSLRK